MSYFSFKSLETAHRRPTIDLIAEVFAADDPLAHSQGLDPIRLKQLIERLFPHFLSTGLSRICLDSRAQRAAAVVLVDDFNPQNSDEGSDAIAAIINSARASYAAMTSLTDDKIVHIHFIASDRQYRHQGLVLRLVDECLQCAKRQGYARVVVETSGNRSLNLFTEHLGFISRVEVAYADFEWQGQIPFASIADQKGLTLLERNL